MLYLICGNTVLVVAWNCQFANERICRYAMKPRGVHRLGQATVEGQIPNMVKHRINVHLLLGVSWKKLLGPQSGTRTGCSLRNKDPYLARWR